MNSSKLIEIIQKLDPSGEAEVYFNDTPFWNLTTVETCTPEKPCLLEQEDQDGNIVFKYKTQGRRLDFRGMGIDGWLQEDLMEEGKDLSTIDYSGLSEKGELRQRFLNKKIRHAAIHHAMILAEWPRYDNYDSPDMCVTSKIMTEMERRLCCLQFALENASELDTWPWWMPHKTEIQKTITHINQWLEDDEDETTNS